MKNYAPHFRSFTSPLALLLLCSLFLTLLTPLSLSVSAAAPPQIAVLGDSISEGYGLDGFVLGSGNPGISSYGNLAAEALGSTYGEDYVNLAVSGDTSEDLLAVIEKNGDALREKDLIFITIGGNDLLHAARDEVEALFGRDGLLARLFAGIPGSSIDSFGSFHPDIDTAAAIDTSSEDLSLLAAMKQLDARLKLEIPRITAAFRDNLTESILRLRRLSPDARIFLQTIYNPMLCTDPTQPLYPVLSVLTRIIEPLLLQLNTVIEELAPILDYEVIDAYAAFTEAGGCPLTSILSFDIHPNAAGHALLAKMLLSAIDPERFDPIDKDAQQSGGDAASNISPTPADTENREDPASRDDPANRDMDSGTLPTAASPAGEPASVKTAADQGKTGPSKLLICTLLLLITAAGCTSIVLIYRRHEKKDPENS